jgi:uroporphyrinogen-III synthase
MRAQLAGETILITRPVEQATRLAQLVRDAGGEAILFPAVEIEVLPETAIESFLKRPGHFDLIVFVSPNAARVALPRILAHGGIPGQAKVAAVGRGTAAELKKNGVEKIISPQEGFDSEALLGELSDMRLAGSRVLIVRGQGGREFLAETLRARGATVEYFECYRRLKPARDTRELASWLDSDAIDACLATSSNIVENLFEIAGNAGRFRLCAVPFFVPHPRVAAVAFSRGVQCVFVAGSGDEALVTGVQTWFARSGAIS